MAITQGTRYSYDQTAAASSAGVGQTPDRRRIYDFSDRIAELSPEESPFFVYLSKVSKVPTSDPVFRVLEDRSKIDWTSRNFYLAAAVNGGSNVSAGSTYAFTVDDGSGASIDWLIKGMVFSVNTVLGSGGYSQAIVRVENAPTDSGSSTSFNGKVIDLSNSGVTGYAVIADNDQCQVIGTAFAEGTGAPDVWSNEIEDTYGYVQDFKTAAELTDWAMATELRGHKSDWNRIWNLKLREHKVDIERAMLFSQKARRSNIQYTEGLVGHILKNSTVEATAGTDLSYSSGKAYFRSLAQAELTYDQILRDFEVLYDPARGGSGDRLVLCGLPVITMFNKLADGKFLFESLQNGTNPSPLNWNFKEGEGRFGHRIMTIDTIHGTAHLVKEPLFRGISSKFMLFADMSKLAYRPLVGNGINLDTHIKTNVQADDEALRKDMIRTSAGLEVVLPECHMLYSIED